MKDHEFADKVYYDDSGTKITASFVASYKEIILPIERVKDVLISHKTHRLYLSLLLCLGLFLAFFLMPAVRNGEVIRYLLILLFCICGIWFRFVFKHYAALYIQLDDDKKYLLRVNSWGKRSDIYDIADAVRAAMAEYKAKCEVESNFQESHTSRLRRINNMLLESNLEKTPELMEIFKIDHKEK